MANESNADIQTQLAILRKSYAKELPVKIEAIEECQQKLVSSNTYDFEEVKNLHRQMHSLAGSGATFGFPELGEHARVIEQILKNWLQDNVSPSDEELNNITIQISQLNELIILPTKEVSVLSAIEPTSKKDEQIPLIYLLDDDPSFASELALQLGHFGYRVKIHTTCNELEKALENKVPSVVICDIVLQEGEMADIYTMRKFNENHLTNVPVIFISTNDNFNVRLEAVRAGSEACFSKPINIDQFVDRLDSITCNDPHESFRILIVDDDETLAAHYKLILQQAGMNVSTLSQPEKIFESIASCNPELIVMDINMPTCSGLELVKLIRQSDSYISLPIVYLSTESDHEKQLTAMDLGGDDFLVKPIKDNYLASSIAIRVKRARQLSELMSQDSLTGLLKHTKIKTQLSNELSRSMRQKSNMVFVMVDIDNFKQVNDTYGHMAGDRVIKSLARMLQQRFRKTDSVGRYGGEEFAVVMPETNLENAKRIVNEIRKDFSDIVFFHEGKEFSVTLSAGLSGYPLHDVAEKINQSADEALYEAKENGRNCVVVDKAKNNS
jgi:diguanylate cyclase (GGDEF)-like protein